jgi:hypothetical protein
MSTPILNALQTIEDQLSSRLSIELEPYAVKITDGKFTLYDEDLLRRTPEEVSSYALGILSMLGRNIEDIVVEELSNVELPDGWLNASSSEVVSSKSS